MADYDFHALQSRWLPVWESLDLFGANRPTGPRRYLVDMFAYPSGDLHMGHAEAYAIGDALARYWFQRGYDVLHPVGWDAFGLPAENAAIRRDQHPADWTYQNIDTQAASFRRYAVSFDWRTRLHTSDPSYYRWTQWLFLRFHQRNLAYRRRAAVNWCPTDQTVLANEQVIAGRCERCGNEVTKRDLTQWFFRITAYADRLLDDMTQLEGHWPAPVLTMQRNWIGRSPGAFLQFDVDGRTVEVFTTRPDTVFGATFLVVAPDSPLAAELCTPGQRKPFESYAATVRHETETDRLAAERPETGVFLGRYAKHPFTGAPLPVWAADYVLSSYGTGAIMAVPAHDPRDLAFAHTFNLPVVPVADAPALSPAHSPLAPSSPSPPSPALSPPALPTPALPSPALPSPAPSSPASAPRPVSAAEWEPTPADGPHVNSDFLDGLHRAEATERAIAEAEARGVGRRGVTYRLRDWLLSRQRFWGCPIPIVHCPSCGEVPVPDDQLPVRLPDLRGAALAPAGVSPLAAARDWVEVPCPACGSPAERDTDTMDTFVDSSWYFLRYPNPGYADGPFDPQGLRRWLPVDQYVGGSEHAILHLLYARFFTKVLHDLGLLDFDEPFRSLLNQGQVILNGAAMSKSKGNMVDLGDQLETYGVDAVRLTMLFAGPPEDDIDWADVSPAGAVRFLTRALRLSDEVTSKPAGPPTTAPTDSEPVGAGPAGDGPAGDGPAGDGPAESGPAESGPAESGPAESGPAGGGSAAGIELRRTTHRLLRAITELIEAHRLNVAVARTMELANAARRAVDEGRGADPALREAVEAIAVVLSLFTPYVAEEMWSRLGHPPGVALAGWPAVDPELAAEATVICAVQVNGKLRDRIEVPADITEADLTALALSSPAVAGRTVTRTIVRPPRLVNLVV